MAEELEVADELEGVEESEEPEGADELEDAEGTPTVRAAGGVGFAGVLICAWALGAARVSRAKMTEA